MEQIDVAVIGAGVTGLAAAAAIAKRGLSVCVLEKHPRVTFIGHAQTWWGNIDRNHEQTVLYPKTKVTPGGITDRLLADYPNMYGDLSAGSGLNSLLRDEEHARGFLERHQEKLVYGSACDDRVGEGAACSGTRAALRSGGARYRRIRKLLLERRQRGRGCFIHVAAVHRDELRLIFGGLRPGIDRAIVVGEQFDRCRSDHAEEIVCTKRTFYAWSCNGFTAMTHAEVERY